MTRTLSQLQKMQDILSLKGMGFSLEEIPEVPTAVCMKVYGPYERLYQNFIDLFAWMEKEGWKVADAPRAVYVDGIWNQEDPEKWLTIIQVPAQRTDILQ